MKGLPPRLLLFFAILPATVLTGFWFARFMPAAASMSLPGMAGAISSVLAQNGIVLLVIVVFLGSRNPLVERSVGLDRMLRFHKPLGVVAAGLLLGHVLLQFLRFYIIGGPELVSAALLTTEIWEMVVGRLALLMLITAGILAFLGVRFRFSFRMWKPVHLIVYAAVPLGLLHAGFRGSTMGDPPRVQVLVILAAATALALIMRLFEVRYGNRRAVCRVSRVVPENHDTRSLYLDVVDGPGDLALRRAGQFALLRIPGGRGFSEPHPFTISGAPEEVELRFTIKQAGRFTRNIHQIDQGSEVRCEGPYGVFCAGAEDCASLALIAGGVGVTPFLSLLRHLLLKGRFVPAVLVWANKTSGDIFCREELEEMTSKMPLRVVHVLSREKDRPGQQESGGSVSFEKGRVTAEILSRFLRADQCFYLCGPPAMQAFVLAEIKKAFGLGSGEVSRELFFW
ncbi:MAG: ferredoxin reductase family protein [Desulfatiglandaceae bacterium]